MAEEMDEEQKAQYIRISRRYFDRADQFKGQRKRKNAANWDAYMGEQDFSHKAEFQSRETTPSFPIAVEQIVGTFERALTDNDDWVDADKIGFGKTFLSPTVVRELLLHYMQRLWTPGNRPETTYGVQAFVGDAIKRGLLEGLVIGKIFPVFTKAKHTRFRKVPRAKLDTGAYQAYELLGEETKPVTTYEMRLGLDLIEWDDYFRDPSPALNYEIHRTRRQLHELRATPDYDQDAVDRIYGQVAHDLDEFRKRNRTGEAYVEPDPYEIEVYECWGNMIDETTGELLHENCFWTWTASGEILRKPTPNPFWDGTSPFIVAPLIRVPGSTVHKALADHVVPMWRASNELVNLLLDQSYRAAWGVGQVRADIMEAPEEIADGIPQGYTAVLKPNVPIGQKFYERVDNGEAPQISLEGLNRLESYVNEGLAMPDTKLGQLPPRQVKSTEIVQAMQASNSLFESLAARFEDTFLEPLFEKAWKLIIQYVDDFVDEELVQILGDRLALTLTSMSPQDRWTLVSTAKFKVRGLRGVAARERRFNKKMGILQLLAATPQLMDVFGRTRSVDKFMDGILTDGGVDADALELEPAEVANAQADQEQGLVAGGQINSDLAAANGASPPGEGNATAEAQQGMEAEFAPTAPQAQ